MKKVEDMRAEYRREDLGKGVRGKHFAAYQKGSNLVLLALSWRRFSQAMRPSMPHWSRSSVLPDLPPA